MKKIKQLLCFLALPLVFSSCASIISNTVQTATFHSEPSGATVTTAKGKVVCPATPCIADVKRSYKSTFVFKKEKHEDNFATLRGGFNPVVLLNILLGGVVGIVIDYASGAAWEYYTPNVYVKLNPASGNTSQPALQQQAPSATSTIYRQP